MFPVILSEAPLQSSYPLNWDGLLLIWSDYKTYEPTALELRRRGMHVFGTLSIQYTDPGLYLIGASFNPEHPVPRFTLASDAVQSFVDSFDQWLPQAAI